MDSNQVKYPEMIKGTNATKIQICQKAIESAGIAIVTLVSCIAAQILTVTWGLGAIFDNGLPSTDIAGFVIFCFCFPLAATIGMSSVYVTVEKFKAIMPTIGILQHTMQEQTVVDTVTTSLVDRGGQRSEITHAEFQTLQEGAVRVKVVGEVPRPSQVIGITVHHGKEDEKWYEWEYITRNGPIKAAVSAPPKRW